MLGYDALEIVNLVYRLLCVFTNLRIDTILLQMDEIPLYFPIFKELW
ncbi:hypothetical protein Cal6303_0188 [Calothrix sp. PCC 6303]|nr:hypothetical protein Cal6303_0188 [Calothrix sp. PCC 6303]